jgi:putative redox protein
MDVTHEGSVVDIDITYDGDLHCTATHRPSGTQFGTDAPVDNQGRGETFSPTDLVATGLGTCMATTLGIVARRRGYALDGLAVHVKKVMTAAPPRRIARLEVELTVPAPTSRSLSTEARAELEHTAHTCPVRLSLLDSIEVPVRFEWQDA